MSKETKNVQDKDKSSKQQQLTQDCKTGGSIVDFLSGVNKEQQMTKDQSPLTYCQKEQKNNSNMKDCNSILELLKPQVTVDVIHGTEKSNDQQPKQYNPYLCELGKAMVTNSIEDTMDQPEYGIGNAFLIHLGNKMMEKNCTKE
jgi:hypothetical protein